MLLAMIQTQTQNKVTENVGVASHKTPSTNAIKTTLLWLKG